MIQNLILTAHASSHSRSAQKEMQRLLAKKRKVDVLPLFYTQLPH